MARNATFWLFAAFFVSVQVSIVCLMIYRENRYVARLYQLQKIEQCKAQLVSEYDAAQHELQKSKNLLALKDYAEQQLNLKKLPLSSFRNAYDDNDL